MPMTPEQKKDALRRLVAVVHETIVDCKDTMLGGIPNGHLYTMLMSFLPDLTFDGYMNIITFLKKDGFITESNNVLSATDKEFLWKSGV